jgi:uncharacterized membrane protein YgdD (TMEM256/DUF423 family)
MTARRVASILGILGVVLGAFGAHALKDQLTAESLEWWKTATLYHLVHAAATLATGREDGRASAATWSFALGVLLFSGSLYAMAVTHVRALGAVTPFGGVAFLVGWALLFLRPRSA